MSLGFFYCFYGVLLKLDNILERIDNACLRLMS